VDPFADIKERLIAQWDRATPEEAPGAGIARFESLEGPRRPRRGLAVGHSVNPETGKPRLEFRVTAATGPNHALAEKLVKKAKADGFDAILRFVGKAFVPATGGAKPILPDRRRPLHIGASVAHRDAHAGTLGAFVTLPGGGNGILSCGHVLARIKNKKKWAAENDPVHQPGWPDQDPVVAGNRVGQLTGLFAPFSDSQRNNLDAAIARLDDNQPHEGNVIPDLPFIPEEFRGRPVGSPVPEGELMVGTDVVKVGRTTGFTEATVSALDFMNLSVTFGSGRLEQTFTFSGIREVLWKNEGPNYAAGGDSGSLVMTREGLRPIGLHFASAEGFGGSRVSYVVPWPKIKTIFGVGLIP
jgi:hypothetical protein